MIQALLPFVGKVLDRLIPDKGERDRAKHELDLLVKTGELELLAGQLKINEMEAKHKSKFVSGWRPFIGWTCGVAFAYHFVVYPIIILVISVVGIDVKLPEFDMGSLLTVLLGMLGLGGFRS